MLFKTKIKPVKPSKQAKKIEGKAPNRVFGAGRC